MMSLSMQSSTGFYSNTNSASNPPQSTLPGFQQTAAPPTTNAPQHSMFSSPAGSESSAKRSRGESLEGSEMANFNNAHNTPFNVQAQQYQVTPPPIPAESSHKRTRSNNYVSPTEVPKTLISSMGTLVPQPAAARSWSGFPSKQRVPLRRELSGSKLEGYLGERDNDDMDVEPSRPRSMSF